MHILLGASVAEWLESLTSNHLPLTAVGSIPGQTGSKIFHPAGLRKVGGSTKVPDRA